MGNRKLNLPLAWPATAVVSILVALTYYVLGVKGDCKPHEIDGQCGLSTFVGLLYGVFAGAVIFVSISLCLLILALKRRRQATSLR
jgi:hypothetical protein